MVKTMSYKNSENQSRSGILTQEKKKCESKVFKFFHYYKVV